MRKTVGRALRISSMVTVTCGYLALATTSAFPPVIMLIPLVLFVLMPFGEWVDGRSRLYGKFFVVLSLLLLVSIPFLFKVMDLLHVVMTVIMYIQFYWLLRRKNAMSYRHLYLMAFFLLLASCVLSPEPTVGAVMAVFLVSALVAFASLHLYVEIEGREPASMADVFPLDQDEASLVGGQGRFRTLKYMAAMAGTAAMALMLTGAFFAFTPRMQAGLLGRSDASLFRTQLSETVNLAQGGQIALDSTAIMRARFPDEPDGQYHGEFYWRCTTLCQYAGSTWERGGLSPIRSEPAFALTARAALARGSQDMVRREKHGDRHLVRQSIYMNEVPAEGVPALTLVQQLRSTGNSRNATLAWGVEGDYTVLVNRRGPRWLEYDAVSEVEDYTPEQLRAAPDNYDEVLSAREYQTLTYQHLRPETLRTMRRLIAGKTTVYDKVLAVMGYLGSAPFLYSRSLPPLPPDDPIDAFLNTTKMGHCQLFASAMALLLRSQGIPTRVASGYRGGEWSGPDGAYVVRADMAHMWVEVYFIGMGWVSFDPSPPDTLPDTVANTFLRTISRYALRLKMVWYRDIISFDRGFQLQALRNFRGGLVQYGLGVWRLGNFGRGPLSAIIPIVWLGTILASMAALFLWGVRYRRETANPWKLSRDQIRVARLYVQFRHALDRKGWASSGKAAEEIGRDLARTPLASPAAQIIAAYNNIRFGGRPLTPEALANLKSLMRTIKTMRIG